MPGEKTPLIEMGKMNLQAPLVDKPGGQLASLGEENAGAAEPEFGTALGKYAGAIIIIFLALGTTGFHFIEGTGTWWDAFYFSCVTLTTVGYGDLTPSTDGGKVLAIFFILIGLSVVAASIGILAGNMESAVDSIESSAMTHTEKKAAKRRKHWCDAFNAFATIMFFIVVGTLVIHFNEGIDWLTAVYWSVVTISSVGYGDVTIVNESTRIFNSFYVLLGVAATAGALGKFASILMEIEEERHVEEFINRGVTVDMIKQIDIDNSGEVDKAEFLCYMLVAMDKCQQKDIDVILGIFDKLDADGGGTIDIADVEAQQQRSVTKYQPPAQPDLYHDL